MKRLTVLIGALMFITFNLSAQYVQNSYTRFGVKGGLNIANITRDKGLIGDNKSIASYNIGLLVDIPLSHYIYFQPAVQLSGKGTKYDISTGSLASVSVKYNPIYVDLQPNFLFKMPLARGMAFYAGLGPYLSIGAFGKAKVEGRILGINYDKSYDIEYTSNKWDETDAGGVAKMKRLDYGINVLVGIEVYNFIFGVNYQAGLANLMGGYADSDNFGKTQLFSLSIGYFF